MKRWIFLLILLGVLLIAIASFILFPQEVSEGLIRVGKLLGGTELTEQISPPTNTPANGIYLPRLRCNATANGPSVDVAVNDYAAYVTYWRDDNRRVTYRIPILQYQKGENIYWSDKCTLPK
ncbi:hypothetical protein HY407_01935 [Candidatus Gottesmanbacteria bacterium]|nr:hypothetical protein [Candidatus Gottesmanbacteria bacterium]